MWLKLTLIALGGAAGALLRYAIGGWVQRFSDTFPIGTLTVNVLGCLLIGLCGGIFARPHLVGPEYRAAILIGLLGSFTTFSTFGFETFELANERAFISAGLNVIMSVGCGLAAVWIGYRFAEQVFGA